MSSGTSETKLAGRRILLSGASGLLGTALRDALHVSGAEVLQLVRRPPTDPHQIAWNPGAAAPVPAPDRLEGLTAAIHLSGANVAAQRWTPTYRRQMWTSRVESTRSLAAVLANLRERPQAFLVASATGIYGDRGDELLTEESSPGTGFLADLCRAWEDAAQPAADAGIRVVHLRFGVVLGGQGGALQKMLPAFRVGLGGRLGSGRQWMSWIALADVVRAVQFALTKQSIAGATNVVAPAPVTNAEFTRALSHVLHRPAMLAVPAFALRLMLGQMADEALLASARVSPRRLLDAGFQFGYPMLEQALRAPSRR